MKSCWRWTEQPGRGGGVTGSGRHGYAINGHSVELTSLCKCPSRIIHKELRWRTHDLLVTTQFIFRAKSPPQVTAVEKWGASSSNPSKPSPPCSHSDDRGTVCKGASLKQWHFSSVLPQVDGLPAIVITTHYSHGVKTLAKIMGGDPQNNTLGYHALRTGDSLTNLCPCLTRNAVYNTTSIKLRTFRFLRRSSVTSGWHRCN